MSGNLTRILNNQIYNGTIIASQKIAAGTITGSLFASNVTIPGDLLISGNLFVLGSSAYTTVASTNTYVNDPLIVLNNGLSSTNTYDEGLIFNRGSLENRAIIWSESGKEFRLIGTTETGTTYGSVTASNYANLHLGNLTVDYAASIGTMSLASLNVSGNILASGGVFNALTVNGNETVTGYLNVTGNVMSTGAIHNALTVNGTTTTQVLNSTGNVLGTGGIFNTLTVNGNETVTGYLNVTGNVMAAVVTASQLNTTGNILATAGVLNALTVNGNETVTGYLNITGNVMAASGIYNYLDVNGNVDLGQTGAVSGSWINVVGNITQTSSGGAVYFNTTGNISAATGVFGGVNTTGYINAGGNVSTPQLNAGQINTTGNVLATAAIVNALTVNGNESVTGYLNVTGNVMAAVVTASQLNTTGNVLATAAVVNALTVNGNETVTGYLNVAGNVLTTAAIANNLTVNGNTSLGLAGQVSGSWTNVVGNITQTTAGGPVYINTTGNISAATGVFGALSLTGFINTSGNISGAQVNAGQFNTTGNILATGGVFNALTVNGNETVTGYLNVTGNILGATGTLSVLGVSNTLWANSSAATTTQGTGALIVPTGGISVAGAANIAGATTIGGAVQFNNTTTHGGLAYFPNTTNANEATGSSGALQIKGGASIAKDLYIGGNIYASNIFSTTYQVITVQDPLLYLDAANTFPYNYDIGFYSNFVGPNPIDNTGNVYQHSGVVRDNADNTWKFFSNVRTEPSGSAITFDTNTIYDPVRAGNLVLTYTQAATSTGTGALQVAGGAGIVGTVVAGQLNSTGNVLGQAGTFNALTVNGNESITGYLNVTGNVLTASLSAGQINTTGNVLATTVGASFLTASTVAVGNIAAVNFGNTGAIFTGASINLSGNVLAAAGVLNALTVNGNESVTGYLNVTGNVLASTVGASYVTASTATVGNIAAVNFGNTGATFTGASINLSGNVLSTGAIHNNLTVNGNTSLGLAGQVSGSWTTVVGNITQTTAGGPVYINTTGNVSAAVGVFGAINSTGYINTSGNISTAQLNAGQINTTGNVLASTVGASFLTASTVAVGNISAVTIGNAGATVTGTTGAFSGNVIGGLAQFAAINNTPIGNATASTGAFTTLTASAGVWANSATNTTSTTTGAIVVPNGGIAVPNGNVYVGSRFYVGPSALAVGVNFSGFTIAASNSDSVYTQIAQQNLDNRGSTDFAAYSSAGNDQGGWIDMGFTGNAFADTSYTITKPNDGYVFAKAESSNFGGNLVLATSQTGNFNDIVIAVGSFLSTAEVMRFHGNIGSSGNAWLKYTTVSTTPTTGALRVDGGVGIVGNIRVGGGAVFNNSQITDPFQVKGKATTTLIYADTAYGAVILGGSNTSTPLGSTVKINGTDSMLLPTGTTAQRPSTTGNVDLAGMIRFNTTVNNMEFYDGSQWQTAGSVFTVISDRQFAGNVAGGYGNVDGTNTAYTIQANSTTSATLVSINGIMQFPTLAYDVSGSTLTFTEPPAPGDVIDVRVLATTTVVSSVTSGNGLNQFVADATGSQIWTGSSVTVQRLNVDNVGNFNYLTGNKVTYNQTAVNIPSTGTPTQIDTWSQTAYTSAKYHITAKVGATNFEAYEALVLTDGSGNAYVTTYGIINNGTSFGTISAAVSGGNVVVSYSSTIAQANVKAQGTFIV